MNQDGVEEVTSVKLYVLVNGVISSGSLMEGLDSHGEHLKEQYTSMENVNLLRIKARFCLEHFRWVVLGGAEFAFPLPTLQGYHLRKIKYFDVEIFVKVNILQTKVHDGVASEVCKANNFHNFMHNVQYKPFIQDLLVLNQLVQSLALNILKLEGGYRTFF